MVNIVIYDKNGVTIPAKATVTKAEQSIRLNSEDVLNVEVGSPEPINFEIGDFINYCGKTYTLNQLPSITKNASNDFRYTLQFEGEQYELLDCAWLLPAHTHRDSLTGNLYAFLEVLFENISRTGRDWQLGEYPHETEVKTLTYSQTNCLNVLQDLCKQYGLEFEILRDGETRILNLKPQVGELFPTRFEYGRTGGAYKIERKTTTNKNVITRLFVFGSDKNLPTSYPIDETQPGGHSLLQYRHSRLCLPNKDKNHSYIEDEESTSVYGIKENVKFFDDIFPQRYGKVTDGYLLDLYDNTMDFNLNETDSDGETKWLIAGTPAKLQFTTGNLAGYSFEITDYNPAWKKFKLKKFTDANGDTFPNQNSAAFQFHVGDEYFLTDIRVPQSYIDAAEIKLQTEGEKYYNENCKPHVNYTISLSPLFLKNIYGDTKLENEVFEAGDTIEVYDFDLQLLKTLRISGFTRNLLNPYDFNLTIAEDVEITSTTQRIIAELTEIKKTVVYNDLQAADNARRNYLATQEVLENVFDPDGFYFSDKIKPLSIETMMLSVGARSQQFVLRNVLFETNYAGNPDTIHNTAGALDHYNISPDGVRTWQINQGTSEQLQNQAYYIYAKCSRSGNNGIIIYSSEQYTVEADPQFYYFLIGTLTSKITDSNGGRPARNIALTYGATTINGRFINTGRIQSKDGSTFIDLDANLIGGNFNFKDGLISKEVLVGGSREEATCGIGGTYFIWAGKNYYNKPLFYVDKKGNVFLNNYYNQPFFVLNPKQEFASIGNIGTKKNGAEIHGNLDVAQNTKIRGNTECQGTLTAGNTTIESLKSNNSIQQRKCRMYNKYYLTAQIPALIWHGKILIYSKYAPVTVYRDFCLARIYDGRTNTKGNKFNISVTRESKGVVNVVFNQEFYDKDDYIAICNGSDDKQCYATIRAKTATGLKIGVSDDASENDRDFYLTILFVGNTVD